MKKLIVACVLFTGLSLTSCQDQVVEELEVPTSSTTTDPDEEKPGGN